MTPYRQDPRVSEPLPPPKKPPVQAVVAVSALAHVALLAACALSAPRDPEPPRTTKIRVVSGQVTQTADGATGMRLDGFSDAIVRER